MSLAKKADIMAMPKRHKWTKDEINLIITEYKNGKSLREIGKLFPHMSGKLHHLAASEIKRQLLKAKIELRSRSEATKLAHQRRGEIDNFTKLQRVKRLKALVESTRSRIAKLEDIHMAYQIELMTLIRELSK